MVSFSLYIESKDLANYSVKTIPKQLFSKQGGPLEFLTSLGVSEVLDNELMA